MQSQINQQDKLPVWDGDIVFYTSHDRKSENLIRRIPVQIKGRGIASNKFSVKRNNLEHYYKEKGVLFVVVEIKNYDSPLIKYATLTSLDLARYLQKCSNKQKISIDLTPVPENIDEFVNILLNFIDTFNRDVKEDALSILDFKKNYSSVFDRYRFTVRATSREGLKAYLKNQSIILMAENSKDGYQIMIDKVRILDISATQRMNETVSVNGKEFYDSYTIMRHFDNKMTMNIGNSLHIHFDFSVKDQLNINLNYALSGKLSDCIHDTEFLILMYKHKAFSVAEHTFSFLMNLDDSLCKKQIESLNYYLRKLNAAKKLLDILNIKKEFDYFSLSEYQSASLQALTDGFLYKKNICINSTEQIILQIVNLGELKIFMELSRNKDGTYSVKDFFKNNYQTYCTKDNDRIKFAGSQFFILDSSDFSSCCNIDYSAIEKSIKVLPNNINILRTVYDFTSSMLLGYDKQKEKSAELLRTVDRICDSMINGKIEENDRNLFKLKKIECACRVRELSKEEKNTLFSMLDENNDNLVKFICHIFLKNQNMIEHSFSKLDDNQKDLFIGNSIKNLMIGLSDDKVLTNVKEHKIHHLGTLPVKK